MLSRGAAEAALPNLIVIGAMKCGTSALHQLLAGHSDIGMSRPKELNFFFGPETGQSWECGNWHRGTAWYACHFDPRAKVRGESSPGYTSPSHPEVAQRIAALVPTAHLLYLVRDPLQRAISQYRHHRADGSEQRPLEQALLDRNSQYVARSRYYERLAGFLDYFDPGAITVIGQEELLAQPHRTLRVICARLGVDGDRWTQGPPPPHAARTDLVRATKRLQDQLRSVLRDDADRLRAFTGRDFAGWSV